MIEKMGELGKFEDNKIVFLNDMKKTDKTRITYYRYLKSFVGIEEVYDKDLALFSREEAIGALRAIHTYSMRTINSIDSLITSYMAWAAQRGINPTGVNPMQNVSVREHLLQNLNIDLLAKRFVTKEDLYKFAASANNAQDAVCLLLPFYGIYGKNCSEIINLKWEDINKIDCTIHIRGNTEEESRYIKVDEELIDYLIKAVNESEYEKEYSLINVDDKSKGYKGNPKLLESEYILKPMVRSNIASDQVTPAVVRKRMERVIKNHKELSKKYQAVTMKSLITSGKFRRLNQIKEENEILTDEDFKKIQVEFNDNPSSYFTLKEDYNFVHKD